MSNLLTKQDKLNLWKRQNRKKHGERERAKARAYYAANAEKIIALKMRYYYADKKKAADKAKRYRQKNLDRLTDYQRKWDADNKKWRNNYKKRRRETDLNWKLKANLTSRISAVLHGRIKSGRTMELLGCSLADFRIYLESKFEPGMTWSNYGYGKDKWNIDHIIPCAIFDLRNPTHQKRCFHFSNQQPLWQPDNMKKGSKVTMNQFQLL